MRFRIAQNGLTVNAIAGTHVVFLGLDLAEGERPGFRGFAFQRVDHAEDEITWLRGMKTFEATEPYPAKGETFSTRHHPIQSFQWCDYSAKPGRQYTYKILALYGSATDLEPRIEVEVPIATEAETGPGHCAFFNRGSVATQEYARRFENRRPKDAGPGAYEWLSRGLIEALLGFIGRAGAGSSIHGAVYEFQWPAVLDALKSARDRGAEVSIVYDDIGKGKKNPSKANRAAAAAAEIAASCTRRAKGRLMHNKFFVLSENGQPAAVWTGSTNLTENGIFGHSNVGHIIEDARVAAAYLDYWQRLRDDPGVNKAYRAANVGATPAPPVPWNAETTAVFSPRGTDLDALDWYAQLAESAEDALMMTFAFGMHDSFKRVYRKDDSVLRMALMEKEGSGAAERRAIQQIRNRRNVVVSVGNRIVTNSFDRWLAEMSKVNPSVHVQWVHTKYMLVDPLGDSPIVVIGSANFSKASTDTNDENMLVIRGNTRVADIYFGEFLRLYTHYAFREAVKWALQKKQAGTAEEWKPQYLIDDDRWMAQYFDPEDRTARFSRRQYFSGPMAVPVAALAGAVPI